MGTFPYTSIAFVGIFAMSLGACAPAPYVVPKGQEGRQFAYFPDFPTKLFEVAASICDAPSETLITQTRTQVECESLPTPEAAAALILQFDGDIERLPTLVNRLEATSREDGYIVEAEYFFRVPQLGADILEVRLPQRDVDRAIQRMFALAGGTAARVPTR